MRRFEDSSMEATICGSRTRLPRPSGTSGIAAGQSGAGESMPAAAHEASCMSSWRSSTATRRFRRDSSKAIEPPMMPPPTMTTSYVFTSLSYQQRRGEGLEGTVALKRFHELDEKNARFLRQILRANPVVGANRFVGLAEEAVDFLDEVFLSGIELPAVCKLHVLFGRRDVRSRIVLRRVEVLGGELGRNLRRRRFRGCRL